jgi:hypothetical protein
MNIEDLRWHDGNILSLELVPNSEGIAKIYIQAELYDNSVRSPGREKFSIQCIGVSVFNAICDLKEIVKNSETGSIHDCTVHRDSLRLSLYDGYIEIRATEFRLNKCQPCAPGDAQKAAHR